MKSSTANCLRKIRNRTSFYTKRCSLVFFSLFLFVFSFSQTLFTYGKHAVSKDEFMRAYNKNSTDTNSQRMPFDDYLELYTRYKLKVQAALDAGLDTTAEQRSELQSFQYQLADSYLKDDASIKLLVDEAFERSAKDIHLSFIFVPAPQNADSTTLKAAHQKIDEAYNRLKQGAPFEQVAPTYDHGTVGFITVFVLPYVLENVAYSTPVGKFSEPVRAPKGFYILKNNKERDASGTIRVAQILLALPPMPKEGKKDELSRLADSIYNALKAGGNFAELAKKYSNDNQTFQNGGEMPAFGVGQFDTTFTEAAFALQKDGDISKPFSTSFGYHILSRIQKIDVARDKNNTEQANMIKEKVMQSDRMQSAQATLVRNIRNIVKKDAPQEVFQSDSSTLEYYRSHLEKYNADFAAQLEEFRQGNLLFAMMQRKVWDAATADSAALVRYYNEHKDRYKWEKSADALIVTCVGPSTADSAMNAVRKDVSNWRQIVQIGNGAIQVDSGRFELGQIPVVDRTDFKEGLVTAPVSNGQDSTRTFAYIIRLHDANEPKAFSDARGSVINDYQVYLEEKWIAELKNKYPVKVNKKVYARLQKMPR
jgi:peptidyl-prolyl cis-trans isomerase SurA